MSLFEMFGEEKLAVEPPLKVPTHCPECGHPVRMDGEFLVCPNSDLCPAQVAGMIKTWIKKLNILDWGESLIEALCRDDLVSTIDDLYHLTVEDIAPLMMSGRRVGESTARKVLENLHEKKEIPLPMFLGSLSIPLVARSMMKKIFSAGFDTMDKMTTATEKDIASIPGVGHVKAANFVQGLEDRDALIQNLLASGVSVKPPSEGPLKGLFICMTGFRDPDMEEAIEESGGTLKNSAGKSLSYLVAADPEGTSGKLQKARKYGVPIISQEQMWDILK